MPRVRKRLGLPGRRLDRVVNAGPHVAASVATATTPPRQPPPRTPAPPRPRVALAGPRFRHAALYGPRDRNHLKVYATIAAYADGGVDDPTIREIAQRVKIPPPASVVVDTNYHILAIVRQLDREGWITVQWAQERWQHNRYVVNGPPRAEK